MTWTRQHPVNPGFYFCRKRDHDPRVLFFTHSPKEEGHPIQPTSGSFSTEGWEEFAGPISPPHEPTPRK